MLWLSNASFPMLMLQVDWMRMCLLLQNMATGSDLLGCFTREAVGLGRVSGRTSWCSSESVTLKSCQAEPCWLLSLCFCCLWVLQLTGMNGNLQFRCWWWSCPSTNDLELHRSFKNMWFSSSHRQELCMVTFLLLLLCEMPCCLQKMSSSLLNVEQNVWEIKTCRIHLPKLIYF